MKKLVVDVITGKETQVALTAAEIASFSSPSSNKRQRFTPLEFLDMFTASEQTAIATKAMSNVQVKLVYDRVLAATFITADDPRVEAGLTLFVNEGIIEEGRKFSILAAMT